MTSASKEEPWSASLTLGGHSIRAWSPDGPPDPVRPVALAVHGMADTSASWSPLVKSLRRSFQVFFLDMPWSTRNGPDWPFAASPERWWREALALIPAAPTLLLGHSFGANVILEWLATGPREQVDRVDGIVLISPYFKRSPEDFDWQVLDHYVNRFHELLADGIRVRITDGRHPAEDLTTMAMFVRERIAPAGWMEFFRLFLRSPDLPLDSLAIPALVLGGDRDISVPVEDLHALGERLPQAETQVLSDCGHYGLLERPESIRQSFEDWLGRHFSAHLHQTSYSSSGTTHAYSDQNRFFVP